MRLDFDKEQVTTAGIQQSGDFTFRADGFLARQLANNYSRPEEAVIREYLCNARDAQVEAGTMDKAIQLKFPTSFNPKLAIRDFGTGLSDEDVPGVFCQFSTDSKRKSNTAIGGFGIGSKSAFAIGASFTVTSYFNHRKSVFVMTFNDDGDPPKWHQAVKQVPTDEPNGLLVEIPVSSSERRQRLIRAAKKLIPWLDVKVEVSGEPEFELYENTWLFRDDRLGVGLFTNDRGYGAQASVVVMGGVPYPLDVNELTNSYDERRMFEQNVALFVPIGEIKPTPSREAIEYSERTKTYLRERLRAAVEPIRKHFTAHIDQTKTKWEAWHEWHRIEGIATSFIRGYTHPTFGEIEGYYAIYASDVGYGFLCSIWGRHEINNAVRRSWNGYIDFRPSDYKIQALNEGKLILLLVDEPHAYVQRINHNYADKDVTLIVFKLDNPADAANFQALLPGSRLVKISDLPKPPSANTGRTGNGVSIRVQKFDVATRQFVDADLNWDKDSGVYVVESASGLMIGSRKEKELGITVWETLNFLADLNQLKDTDVFVIGAARKGAAERRDQWVELSTFVRQRIDLLRKENEWDKAIAAVREASRYRFIRGGIDTNLIKETLKQPKLPKDFRDFFAPIAVSEDTAKVAKMAANLINKFTNELVSLVEYDPPEADDLIRKYPMLRMSYGQVGPEHLAAYLNWVNSKGSRS